MAVYTTVDDSEAYYQNALYTGNGGTQSITFAGTTDMQPDLVWNKSRSNTEEHNMWDPVRGATVGLVIQSSSESTWSTGVTSFNSDGWTMGLLDSCNSNTVTFVAWCWKESATSGFDIVGYTGNGSARTISHSLSAVPHVILLKNRDTSDAWRVYHHRNTSAPATDYLDLDNTSATTDAADVWNDTAPTSSVFSVGDASNVNENTEDYIAYLFSEKQGFSKFGSYVGNGNADGPFVYTGFKPAFVMMKESTSASAWTMVDGGREPFNEAGAKTSFCNLNTAEATGSGVDFLSNGFKLRSTDTNSNADGETSIYIAFAEAPFVNSNGVPCNAR